MSDPTGKALQAGSTSVVVDALRVIGAVTPLAGETFDIGLAEKIFRFTHSVIEAIEGGLSRKLTPDEVRAELVRFREDIERERAATEATIAGFKGSDATVDATIEAARKRLGPRKDDE